MTQSQCEDMLADFAHELRQPLSVLEALTSYLDLIITTKDPRVDEQLQRMHSEIGHADQILREGLRTLSRKLVPQGCSGLTEVAPVPPCEGGVEELAQPLTQAAMASVTY